MGDVYVYAADAEDFGTIGLAGALCPTECTHEEIAGGMSSLTLVHPFDAGGKWRVIQRGCVLKADVRVRTTPEIEAGQVATTVEVWTVKATATSGQRTVYSKASGGRKIGKPLKSGTKVTVTKKGEKRHKIRTGKVSGWISIHGIDFEIAEALPGGDIEAVCPPWSVRPQLFRVQSVEVDTEGGTVTAYAPHISYDLMGNLTSYTNPEPLTAVEALQGIMGGCNFAHEFECHTDMADERTGCDWRDVSPIEALLDPEEGFLARWGAELVRDNYELYFLRRAGRNRGARIEYGKNLLGVTLETSEESVVTAIKPTGTDKKGKVMYLTGDASSPDNYVLSPRAGDYPTRRAYVLACDSCTVSDKISKELARKRMREQAQKLLDDGCDLPEVSLTVDFVSLGDTIEYAQYKDLEPLYLYDEVAVADKAHGVEVMTDVHRVVWDCLLERVIEAELGNVRAGLGSVYSWQVSSLDGHKLKPETVPGGAIEDGTIPEGKLDPDLQAALDQAWADVASTKELLGQTNKWLDELDAQLETVTLAVGDNTSDIAALRVAADEIRTAVRDAEGNISTLQQTATSLRTAMSDAQGDISTLRQSANGMASTVSSLAGDISSLRQKADSISSTVSTLNGQVQSLITQTANQVAIKLCDKAVNSNFEVIVRSSREYSWWAGGTCYGIEMHYNGGYYGGLFLDTSSVDVVSSKDDWNQLLVSPGHQRIICEDSLDIMAGDNVHASGAAMYIMMSSGYAEGKRLRASEALTVVSDRRAKIDIAPIDQGEALFDQLKPVQFRMKSGGPCLHYGFIAQEVREALEGLGIPETVMLCEPAGADDYMALSYQEFIALTAHKVQRMQARIDDLERRVAALEATKS